MRNIALVLVVLSILNMTGFAQEPVGESHSTPALLFERGMSALTGSAASRNDVEAVSLVRRAAEQGYAPAQYVMGYWSEIGFNMPRDSRHAADWYRKSGDQGDRVAQWALGRFYYIGEGVPRDFASAETWLNKSASSGDPLAQYLLGLVKEERSPGSGIDPLRKAAEQGISHAQYKYGLLLKQGRGTSTDRFEAYIWLLLSFEAGMAPAGEHLRELEAQLGTTNTEKAKVEARSRKNRVSRSILANGCSGWSGELDQIPSPPPPDVHQFCR